MRARDRLPGSTTRSASSTILAASPADRSRAAHHGLAALLPAGVCNLCKVARRAN
jgi:hypothetical protein